MYFTTLKSYSDVAEVENKVRINLSRFAVSILSQDMDTFGETKKSDNILTSALLNHIFSCYKDAALASISATLNAVKEEFTALFSGIPNANLAVDQILRKRGKELRDMAEQNLSERNQSFPIRINAENLSFLQEEGYAEHEYYNDRISLYIKAVIEEYCRLPYPQREMHYFRNIWNETNRAINERSILKLKLTSKNTLYMKPMCIKQDTEHLYNYLVGMISTTQGGPWKIGSVRLTSVDDASCLARQGVLSNDEKKQIDHEIAARGVQFLSNKMGAIKVIVKFTENGARQYQKILHLRPTCVSQNGLTYEFFCTQWQAENYFFKFGQNAKILEPKQLAESFKHDYLAAANNYED